MITNGLENCGAFIDDVIINNDTSEEHLKTIQKFFDRLSDAQLTINLNKTEFCKAHVQYLCHIVGQSQVKPTDVKVKAISRKEIKICMV